MAKEINFDGLVGPTHNYAGLAFGNVASLKNKRSLSQPKEAALQGLAKMKSMMDLGIPQAILPPQERPAMQVLRAKGYTGSVASVLEKVWHNDIGLLMACSSASSMWTANAATIAPSQDTKDNKVHITPANLQTQYHRAIEVETTTRILQRIFEDDRFFKVHPPLPARTEFFDEGAANHTRLANSHSGVGLHVFAYGLQRSGDHCFPSRQTLQASQRIAALHELMPDQVVSVEQNPVAIDAGVFHNDVIAVGNESVFMYHEDAYVNERAALAEIRRKYKAIHPCDLTVIRVARDALPLADAVATYLFNSQIVSLADGSMALIAPKECEDNPYASSVIAEIIADASNSINAVHFLNLRQSMRNGGGPACLRLRMVLSEEECTAINAHVIMDDGLHTALVELVKKHYRDELMLEDLRDPLLYEESCRFLDALTQLLDLGMVYDFQKE